MTEIVEIVEIVEKVTEIEKKCCYTESEVETRRVKVSSENISSNSLSNNGKQCGNRYGGY